jgi:hypothetical protein
MRQLIGKNGCNFKNLTQNLNLQYIWWNKKTNVIELWGNHHNLLSAKTYIQKFIDHFTFSAPLERCNAATPAELKSMTKFLFEIPQ